MGCQNSRPLADPDVMNKRKRFTIDDLIDQEIEHNKSQRTLNSNKSDDSDNENDDSCNSDDDNSFKATEKKESIKSNPIKRSVSMGKKVEHNYFAKSHNKPLNLDDLDATIDEDSIDHTNKPINNHKKNKKHQKKLVKNDSDEQSIRDIKLKQQIESLDVLVEAIYDAVNKAQRNIRLNNLNELDFYFPYDDKSGMRKPKTVKIKLPSQAGEEEIMDVPLFSLINHTPLNIEEFNVKFKINMSTAKRIQDRYGNHVHFRERKYKICTDIRGANKKNIAEVELRCKAEDTPEGISRIADALHKTL